ncbi:MAG: mechanosensitive ion channel family protein [Microbacteriaceae bacterium]|jgi:small conductance mechanosensitive channel
MSLGDGWVSVIDWLDGLRAPWNGLAIIVLIAVIAIALRAILVWVVHLVVTRVVRSARKHQDGQQVAQNGVAAHARIVQRARTMGTILTGLTTWAIGIFAFFAVLYYGFDVSPTALVASAGITAAIVGFGAQNTIKDVINGLMIVFEDQLGVGDVVDLGLASGVVESVGIRVTTLRGDDGTVWYVRNGEILRIGNQSQTIDASSVVRVGRGTRSRVSQRRTRKTSSTNSRSATDAGTEQQQRRND